MGREIEEIRGSIRAANRARAKAYDSGDASALAAAVRAQLMARRSAGILLNADPALVSNIGKSTAEHWCALARLGDGQFAEKIELTTRRAIAALNDPPRAGGTCPQIKMTLTPWTRTPDGALTRELMAVDVGGADAGSGSADDTVQVVSKRGSCRSVGATSR